MKSIYFLILNYIQYIPYAYGLLRAYAEQDPVIRENYEWKEPFCDVEVHLFGTGCDPQEHLSDSAYRSIRFCLC